MAKIDFPDGTSPFLNPALQSKLLQEEKKTTKKGRVAAFSSILGATESEAEGVAEITELPFTEDSLRRLLDSVHTAGDELKTRPFPAEIVKYKQAVRDFLHFIVKNGYTTQERTSGFNILKRKKYTLVQVIDHKLERLAADILSGQNAQIDILARVDEINGLLVDLMQ